MTAANPKEAPASGGPAAAAAAPAAGGTAPAAGAKKDNKSAATSSSGDAPKKLTGAELKAQKQAEKAKRRAAVVAAKEAAGIPTGSTGGGGGGGSAPAGATGGSSGGAPKGKQGSGPGATTGGSASGGNTSGGPAASGPGPALARRPSVSAAAAAAEREKELRSAVPEAFNHLSMAKRISVAQAHKDVHPAVLAVGQKMATFALRDSMARLEATLVAFKKVIESYSKPPDQAFSRHFVPHVLNHQIEYLTECRPMCFAMGNAIRLLKARVSQIDVALDDKAAVAELCESIDTFIQERIRVAAVSIVREAANMIQDGDVILTYGGPRLVSAALDQAWANGTRFDLTVIDDTRDSTAGQTLVKKFKQRKRRNTTASPPATSNDPFQRGHNVATNSDDDNGGRINVTYGALSDIDRHMNQADKVFLGVESVFVNGALLAQQGTSEVSETAAALGRPVLALCETVNFDRDRVASDPMAYNEIDPDNSDSDSLKLLFDVTQANLVSMLITEYEEARGQSPEQAIYSLLRNKEDTN